MITSYEDLNKTIVIIVGMYSRICFLENVEMVLMNERLEDIGRYESVNLISIRQINYITLLCV